MNSTHIARYSDILLASSILPYNTNVGAAYKTGKEADKVNGNGEYIYFKNDHLKWLKSEII